MSNAGSVYQKVILDHCHHPRNEGPLASPDREGTVKNSLCGDQVTVYLEIRDQRIDRVSFEARGCALARASASLLTGVVKDKPTDAALELAQSVHKFGIGQSDRFEADLEEMKPFETLPLRSSRRQCVDLAWRALESALLNREAIDISANTLSEDNNHG